jgi:hypothetical protein
MCEYSGKLIAWLDRELADQEAANVERHVGQCAECRRTARSFEEISGAFLACYEAAMIAQPRRRTQFWVGAGVAAAAAIVGALLLMPAPEEKLVFHPPSPPPAPIMATLVRAHERHHAVPSPIHRQWIADEPVVQVALPADALFPPGAVPEGFSFIADVRFQQ